MNCFESSTKEFRLCPEDVGGDTEEFKVDQWVRIITLGVGMEAEQSVQ